MDRVSRAGTPLGMIVPHIHNNQKEPTVKRIDTHSHVIPESIIEAMREQPELYRSRIDAESGRYTFMRGKAKFDLIPEFYDAQAKVEAMDRKGIDISYISPGPQAFCYWLGEADAVRTARLVNEGIARMVAQRPERLRGMGSLPMPHPDAAVAELERVVKEHGFKGIEVATSVAGEELAHKKFRPVLRRAQELKVVMFTHPENIGATGRLDCYYLTNFIGNPLDTTIMVANLMLSGALDELRDLRILLPHAGGFVPYQIGRFEHGHKVRPDARVDTQTAPLSLLRRFYFDALSHHPQAVRHLLEMVGSERVVIGTDAPFDMGEEQPLEQLDAVPALTAKEREDVSYRTAAKLFGESP